MQLPSGQKIVCDLTDATFDTLADVHRWQVFRLLEDAQYLQENAALTAEGAIHLAAMHLTRALSDCHILVTGYGRIGKRLTELLRAAGAAVTVAARRKESRSEAGADSITIEEIAGRLRETDVYSTQFPPASWLKKRCATLPRERCRWNCPARPTASTGRPLNGWACCIVWKAASRAVTAPNLPPKRCFAS